MATIKMSDNELDQSEKRSPPSRQNSQQSAESSCSSFERIDEDETTVAAGGAVVGDANVQDLFANALPKLVLLGNEIVDTPDPDPRTVPIKPEQEQYYTPESMRSALGNLVMFSVLMFTLPFVSMYLSYYYVFIGYFHLTQQEAMLDCAIVGIGTVFFVMAGFVWIAYREECDAEKEKKRREREAGETKTGKGASDIGLAAGDIAEETKKDK